MVGILIASTVGGVILAVAHFVPLRSVETHIVAPERAPEIITLAVGETLTQEFQVVDSALTGIVLYANAPLWDQRRLSVRLLDKTGTLLAHGSRAKISYLPDDTLRIAIKTNRIKVVPPEHIVAEITLRSGSPLPLRVSTTDVHQGSNITFRGHSQPQDIALGTLLPLPLGAGAQRGVLAGVIVMIGVAVLEVSPRRWRWIFAGLLLTIVTPLALSGFWYSTGVLGISDWDYYFSLHESYRRSIVLYHDFPFWNPYTCGGTAGLGDPEFPGLTITFLLELLFGIPRGIRLAIFTSVIVGGLGMLALGKKLNLSPSAALLAAIGMSFGSVTLLEITEGHVNVFAAMWIPWIFAAWLRAYREQAVSSATKLINLRLLLPTRASAWCSFFLALTFLQGGIYLLLYTILAFILLILLVGRWRAAVVTTIRSGVWAMGIAAVKLLPVLLWLRQFPDDAYASSTYTLPWIGSILFGRYVHGSYILFRQSSGWHEYGAYVGVLLVLVALIGLLAHRRSRLVRAIAIGGIAALLLSASGPALRPIFDAMPYLPRSNISRIILFTVIAISLLASFGLDRLRSWRIGKLLVPLVIGLVAVDLMSLAHQLSKQSFVLPPVYPLVSPAPSPIAFTAERFDSSGSDIRQTRAYEAARAGYGTFAYCSVLGPKPRVITIQDESDSRVVVAEPEAAQLELISWSPNKVVVALTTTVPTEVILNTNEVAGWFVNNKPGYSVNGRVAGQVGPGKHRVVFQYRAPGFKIGLATTILTLVALGYFLHRRKSATPPV